MASSSSSPLWKFDVFLSFRGVDTRRTFVGFLYKELDRKGIKTFKDDEELERGEYISPALLQAVDESKFAVVIMSENYASSGWCLEELAKIIECHEKGTLRAIPVFYEVEPSHVRRQTAKFAEYLKKHEGAENREKVQRWRDALTKLANISGESSQDWKDYSELIDKIVNEVSHRLISTTSSDFSGLVGTDVRMEAMYELLGLESNHEIRMIGIWGMGGIGKTTLARYVYEEISRHFQTHCFLENIKKIYRDGSPSCLQEELLSKTQGGTVAIRSSYVGSNVIKSRLRHQKVLLVADDVDKIEQFDSIANDLSWFGPGSRIIVTTRDKHLLDACGVKRIYEVKCLKYFEALQLFGQFAFRDKHDLTGFEKLSDRAVKLAGGLPLALKLFGSFLSSRAKEDWEIALDRLKKSPHKGVMEILKISFEGLDEQEKSIFLRVACFFNGEHVDHVTRLVHDDFQHANMGIKILVERSLMRISSQREITMHDLVQQMGRELARQQSLDEPRKRLILCEPDEILDVLTHKLGTKAIEGISFDMAEVDELIINKKAFEKMPNLRFLKIYTSSYDREVKVCIPPSINFFAPKLKYLRWNEYPSKTLQFYPQCLVELNMPLSKLEKLWDGSPCLGSLKKIDLSWSKKLKEFPNLSKAPNLEEILAFNCRSLTEIPLSISSLSKLTAFDLGYCDRLQHLPNNMNLESLEALRLCGCISLKAFPQFSRGIKHLSLYAGRQSELPESIGYLLHLEKLSLAEFEWLENLPDAIGNLTSLRDLTLVECPKLQRIPETIQKLKSLEYFLIENCQSITEFPHLPENVTQVTFVGTTIREIPSWIGDLRYLRTLDISGNERLKRLPVSIYNLKLLQRLSIFRISHLESFSMRLFVDFAMAFRHCLPIRSTINTRWCQPFYGYTIPHDNNREAESFCPTPTQRNYHCFPCHKSSNNLAFAQNSGGCSHLSLCSPSGFTLFRYLSTSHDAGSDKIGVINDVAEVYSNSILQVVASFLPIAGLLHFIDMVHSCTGFNWWASIVLSTLLIRGATIPIMIDDLRSTSKCVGWDPAAVAQGREEVENMLKEESSWCVSRLASLKFYINTPVFFCILFTFECMATTVPSFKTGGALWFTDLTTPDSLCILPILTILLFSKTVVCNTVEGMEGNPLFFPDRHRYLVLLPFVACTMAAKKALCCYWITSLLFSLICGHVLKRPAVMKCFGIPEIPQSVLSTVPSFRLLRRRRMELLGER